MSARRSRGAEFGVNTYSTGLQMFPSVAGDARGNFAVVWRDTRFDGSLENVHGQRFGGLAHGAGGGRARQLGWEPSAGGEAELAEHQRRRTELRRRAVQITGPAGATYGIADNTVGYGSVADGASAACTDCCVALVSDPANRPATHWDATALETITPTRTDRSSAARCTSAGSRRRRRSR